MKTVEKFLKEMEKYLEDEYHNPAPLNVFDMFEDAPRINTIIYNILQNKRDESSYLTQSLIAINKNLFKNIGGEKNDN